MQNGQAIRQVQVMGYTTVPVTVRRVLDISNGDEIEWYLTSSGHVVVKCRKKLKRGGEGGSN